MSRGDSVDAKPKRKTEPGAQSSKLKKSFVKRSGKFVPVASVQDLKEGENLFRHRKRQFGTSERYIRYSTFTKKEK